MQNYVRGAALAAAAACASCTHLETRPTGDLASVTPGAAAGKGAQRGLSYALPMVQYDLKVTRALDKCPDDESAPLITAKVSTVERYVAGERFEIDYGALASVMKTTNFDISYHETGTIKAINASAKDQTGPVLTDVARIGIAVASVAAGNPLPVTAGAFKSMSKPGQFTMKGLGFEPVEGRPAPVVRLRCTQAARNALAKLTTSKDDVETWTGSVANLTQAVERLSQLAALRVLSRKDKRNLAATVRLLLDAEDELRTHKAALAAAQSTLSATEELSWPGVTAGSASHQATISAGPESLDKLWKLFEVVVVDGPTIPAESQRDVQVACHSTARLKTANECLKEATSLNLALAPVVEGASASQSASSSRAQKRASERAVIGIDHKLWSKGVFVREPAEARLVVCRYPGKPSAAGCDNYKTTVLRDKIVVAPQLGRLRLLPFTNGPFEDNELQLSMRANGQIDKFKYGEESAAAAGSSALAAIAEKFDASLEKMEEERRSDEKYARETQSWMRTEAAAIRSDELAKLTTQIEQTNKQLDLLKAQAALAGGEQSIQMAAEQARLDAEVKELQSQVAKLKAAAELASLSQPAN